MSEPTDPTRPEPTDPAVVPAGATSPVAVASGADVPAEARPPRVTPAVGALLVVVAVTSLLDDADLVAVPWWAPFAAGTLVAALAVVALMGRRLLNVDRPRPAS